MTCHLLYLLLPCTGSPRCPWTARWGGTRARTWPQPWRDATVLQDTRQDRGTLSSANAFPYQNLRIKTEPSMVGADAKVYVWFLCYAIPPPPPPSVWLRSRGWGKGVTSTPTCSNSYFSFVAYSSWFFTCILFWHLNTYIISDTETRHTPLHLLQLWQARFLQRYNGFWDSVWNACIGCTKVVSH